MVRRIVILTLVALSALCVVKYYSTTGRVEAQSKQISHVRIAGCLTPQGGTCTKSGSWSPAFLDTNYTANCTSVGNVGNGYIWISSKSAAGVTVILAADLLGGAAKQAASNVSFDCIAIHD